ncbi:MAG TPA: histidine kinase dimerization/phospho-acceptor domain-containing protein [Acidobacteriota bacterium]|nr:histidine kinase dimerization/phospho-acceptor domain-containing protein [Acidobacteriota bacterium]
MDNKDSNRYEILRQLALAGCQGEDLQQTGETALRLAAGLIGLQAAALYLWDEAMTVTMNAHCAETEAARERLESLEGDLFRSLRQERKLLSAYMSFGGDSPLHAFTLPLYHQERVFGAVIGIHEGAAKLVSEDAFLEALSAAIALNVAARGVEKDTAVGRDVLDKERLGAIIETAVTVNHEINNPLTAILGNVQLLLLKRQDLDQELAAKLKTIEISALKIRDVTQRLLRLTSARSVPYAEGTSMLDLSDHGKEDE